MTASAIGTRLGKKVLDKIEDVTFFNWTQRILLSIGAVCIIRAVYLINI